MNIKELTYSPCIVYCHGNGGNKIDIIEIFDYLLWEFNIFSFDFSGSGLSEGEYVTLGFHEKDDVKAVVDFLRNDLNIPKIILYGRSMGAVSALRYAAEDPNIKALVLDSPFASFPKLCREILFNRFLIPEMISNILIEFARDKIKSKIEAFDIKALIPSNNATKVMVPTIMIHGLQDSLVHFSNSRTIYSSFNKNTYKKLLEVEGEHNDCRSKKDHCIIRDFIIQFAYDMSIINEYRRRMNTLSAQILFAKRNGIKINKVIKNMKTRFDKKRKLNNFNIMVKNNEKDSLEKSLSLKDISRLDNELKRKIRPKSTDLNEELDKIKINVSPCKVITEDYKKRDNSTNCNNVRVDRLNAMLEFNVKKKTKYYIDLDKTIKHDSFKKVKPIDKILFNDTIVITENPYATTNTVPEENNINSENLKILSQNIMNDNKNQMNIQCTKETPQTLNEIENAKSNDLKRIFSISNLPKIKPRLRSERNNMVGGILGSEIRITSDNIKIENLDRSTLRRKISKD